MLSGPLEHDQFDDKTILADVHVTLHPEGSVVESAGLFAVETWQEPYNDAMKVFSAD